MKINEFYPIVITGFVLVSLIALLNWFGATTNELNTFISITGVTLLVVQVTIQQFFNKNLEQYKLGLNKELEAHKFSLQANIETQKNELATSLENVRKDLNADLEAHRHKLSLENLKNSKIYEKIFLTINTLYEKITDCQSYILSFRVGTENGVIDKARKPLHDLQTFYKMNKLLFSGELCNKVDSILSHYFEILSAAISIKDAQKSEHHDNREQWNRIEGTVNKLPEIIDSIEYEMKRAIDLKFY